MAGVSVSSLSTQYVQVPVRAYSGGTVYNPTALAAYMAFVAPGSLPAGGDWNTADWAWTATDLGYYAVQCLVGPSGSAVALAVGPYGVWVKVEGAEEVPVIPAGGLAVM